MSSGRLLLLIALVAAFAASPTQSQTLIRKERAVGASGLPTPRFVSLGTDKANLRTGPGEQYPILWVYVREGVPLEITDEYGAWRRVRDMEGTTGWMHGALLSGKRKGIISGATRTITAEPDPAARALLRAEPGVVLAIESCGGGWCKVDIKGRTGWILQEYFWGTYSDETIG